MHCPYCQSPVVEDSAACPRCGLTLEKANAFFGTVPRLMHGVSDATGVLSRGDARRIRSRIQAFHRRFPQCGFTVAFMALAKDTPGATYTWWVFNRCNPAGELNQGFANRHLFLLVDTAGTGAWLTAGYGLEPFVGRPLLEEILLSSRPQLAAGDYAGGVITVLNTAESLLRKVVAGLPRAFGLEKIEPGVAARVAEPANAW